jgi:hypothetical protein
MDNDVLKSPVPSWKVSRHISDRKGWKTRREAFPDHIEGQVRDGHEWSSLDQPVLYLPVRKQATGALNVAHDVFQSLP